VAEPYLAVPPGPGPHPGVVLVHEALGLTDDIRRQADRFAARGYTALAPDLFATGAAKPLCVLGAFRSLATGKGPAIDAIEAARAELAARPDATGKVAIIGFCMGGGFALLAAPKLPFAAASANYGVVPRDARRFFAGACPVVGSYGRKDLWLHGAARKLEQALDANGVPHDVKEYPGASHSFLSQYSGKTQVLARITGIGYHAPSAEDAWRRIDAFFDEHVRA
jgi:carboxymethylenebutenolidase